MLASVSIHNEFIVCKLKGPIGPKWYIEVTIFIWSTER